MLRSSLLGVLRAGRGLLSLLSQFPSCATSAPGSYLCLFSRVVLTCVRIKVRFGGPELLLGVDAVEKGLERTAER